MQEESVYYYNPLAFKARWSVWVNGHAYGMSTNPDDIEDGKLDLGEMPAITFRHMCAETGQIRVDTYRVKPEILAQVEAIAGEAQPIPENSSEPEGDGGWGDDDWGVQPEPELEPEPEPEPAKADDELELDW